MQTNSSGTGRIIVVLAVLIVVALAAYYFLADPEVEFDGSLAYDLVVQQEALGPRVPGSEAHQNLQSLIVNTLTERQWEAEVLPCTVREGLVAYNIVAKTGSGDEWIILGAHYDSRVHADRGPNPDDQVLPVPGANDGGSGVAVLLELARVLQADTKDQEIWMVFFDLEDNGQIPPYNDWILGSTCFVQQLPELNSGRTPSAAVIVDMIGDEDLHIFYERNSTTVLKQDIWNIARELGYEQFIPEDKHSIIDDHVPFLDAGIPAVDIIDIDYPYYHTLEDTSDHVSAASLEAVGRTLQTWLKSR